MLENSNLKSDSTAPVLVYGEMLGYVRFGCLRNQFHWKLQVLLEANLPSRFFHCISVIKPIDVDTHQTFAYSLASADVNHHLVNILTPRHCSDYLYVWQYYYFDYPYHQKQLILCSLIQRDLIVRQTRSSALLDHRGSLGHLLMNIEYGFDCRSPFQFLLINSFY